MMGIGIKELGAKIRNLCCLSDFQKRYNDDDRIQVKTHNGKVLEKNEAFPYGFYAKAKGGKALVFCQGGNFDNFEIIPVMKEKPVFRPALEDGDAALYTGEGSYIILREGGDLEVYTRKQGDIKVECTGNNNIAIDGDNNIEIKGNSQIVCGGNSSIAIEGDNNIEIKGNSEIACAGNSTIRVGGDCDAEVSGNYTLKAKTFKVSAERIDLN